MWDLFFSKLHCRVDQIYVMPYDGREVTPVGFEPTQLALVELESTSLDHSGKVSMVTQSQADRWRTELWSKRIDGEGIFVQV